MCYGPVTKEEGGLNDQQHTHETRGHARHVQSPESISEEHCRHKSREGDVDVIDRSGVGKGDPLQSVE